jgi:hypothetical protein
MMGSQASLGQGDRGGPQLPGLENLGADAVVAGGITVDPNIPAGMEFIPSSIPDGEITFSVASTGTGGSYQIDVRSPCMTFEDFYAAFAPNSHPSLSVTPSTGRLDRRSGERTLFPSYQCAAVLLKSTNQLTNQNVMFFAIFILLDACSSFAVSLSVFFHYFLSFFVECNQTTHIFFIATSLQIHCIPNGQGGTFQGDLVINLPDDNSKICYKVTVQSM